ncbi:MAG: RNA polymerase sigma factor [Clostridia bacterium]|nr:RNA polymerase sigma factor [Clostridia bacterium]
MVNIVHEEKLKQLMGDYGKLVFSICYRLVNDYFTAEDLTQDTFVSAFTSLDRFDGQNEKAWLTRIATNKCLDHLKSAAQRTKPCESDELEFRAGASPLLEDEYIKSQLSADVRKACEELREPYRSVAIEYFCEDKPLSLIAKQTGEPLKTVQTRAYRAKKMLRENLKEVIPL